MGEPLEGSVSINPGATREAVMRLMDYGLEIPKFALFQIGRKGDGFDLIGTISGYYDIKEFLIQ